MSQKKSVSIIPGQFPQTVHLSQGDVGREFVLTLVDANGAYAVPAGATVKFLGTKPSGLGFTADVVMSSDSNSTRCIATITSTYDMTSEYGRFPAELRITQGNDVLGTANVYLDIEKNPHPEGTTDGSMDTLIPELTILVERVEAAVAKEEVLHEAEAWAVGKRNGETVPSTDPTYHNNAKYYANQAKTAKANAVDAATAAEGYKDNAAGSALEANQRKTEAENAKAAAEEAQAAAEAAAQEASNTFQIAGDTSFSVNPTTKKVTMHVTISE